MEKLEDIKPLDTKATSSIVGGGVPGWYYGMLWKIGVSGYKHRKDIMNGFDRGFNNYPK